MSKTEINCQKISHAIKENESYFSNLLKAQESKTESTKFEGYLS